jgi:DNA-binding transcriptional LysR family regulator
MDLRHTNIPMETLRAVVAIAVNGSLSKAANMLCLSQPAVSAQIKRIEGLVGGSIFTRTSSGSTTTELGRLVVLHARRIVESNDQLLRLRGGPEANRFLRLGISNLYAETLFDSKIDLSWAAVTADHSTAVLLGLLNGFIDIALALVTDETKIDVSLRKIDERAIRLVWVRSPNFVLSPGSPIPLLTWPGQFADEIMTRALEEASMIYKVTFLSPDHHATLAAAKAGAGLMVLPEDMLVPGLQHAKEYYLPPLKPVKLLLCERTDLASKQKIDLINFLKATFFEPPILRASA